MGVGPAKREVVIIGAGGFGHELWQYATDLENLVVKGFLDDRDPGEVTTPQQLPVLGRVFEYPVTGTESFLLAVGEPTVRAKIVARFLALGAEFETIVHPKAYVASTATIGAGCIVAPFATVGAFARLGDFTQVHFYASAAHDVVIGRYSALSPYSVVNGGGRLGEAVFLGTRATVNPLKRVGDHAKVAAAAVVYQDVPSWSLAAGNPAKSRPLLRGAAGGQEHEPGAAS